MTEPDNFYRAYDVPRETQKRLELYVSLLEKWQQKINLVSASTLRDVWRRHILDSAQLIPLAPSEGGVWVDLGSGAGFPGLVIAIMTEYQVHLIESDSRKCAFLNEAARRTGAAITIHNQRIEQADPIAAAVVSARALAPLAKLLGYAAPFFGPDTIGLFLKGQDVGLELTEATKYWNMDAVTTPSQSDAEGRIIQIRRLRHA